ncbi:HAD family hydrolase [Scopulibacillus cellulosilyticus]|uniref:HAD family hydrolase n=1 Tax=Scopulibacillus cellulosilyticus TaxID=2665665 RepID=A0ABW2Q1Z9_9BACL
MIKAVIFDFDGLIIDTETRHFQVIQELFREYKAEMPLSVWQRCIGTHLDDWDEISYLEMQISQSIDRDKFNTRWQKKVLAKLETDKARPGVENYLLKAKALGLKIGLATSSGYDWVSGHLERLGLLQSFDCIRTRDDVKRVKPDPELYLTVAECLGVKPEEAVAFEDSLNGSLAAKRAGMYCVIVPNEVTATMSFGDVDHRMESMADIELKELIDFLKR